MTAKVISMVAGRIYILCSALSLGYVAILALAKPQLVMDLVSVKLSNTDALSSIRGVYGGVGMTIFVLLIYLAVDHIEKGVTFLSIFWGSYAASRLMTWVVDGPLGDFGLQWLWIEAFLCGVGLVLMLLGRKIKSK